MVAVLIGDRNGASVLPSSRNSTRMDGDLISSRCMGIDCSEISKKSSSPDVFTVTVSARFRRYDPMAVYRRPRQTLSRSILVAVGFVAVGVMAVAVVAVGVVAVVVVAAVVLNRRLFWRRRCCPRRCHRRRFRSPNVDAEFNGYAGPSNSGRQSGSTMSAVVSVSH